MQINCAQPGCAGASHVGRGLQNIELCSQPGGEICFCDLERFVCGLDIFSFRFQHVVRLPEVEERAANFGGDRSPGRIQRSPGRLASRVGGLHSSLGRKAVEDVPGAAHTDEITVIEFRSD